MPAPAAKTYRRTQTTKGPNDFLAKPCERAKRVHDPVKIAALRPDPCRSKAHLQDEFAPNCRVSRLFNGCLSRNTVASRTEEASWPVIAL
jgi:hypothetical protein